MLSLVTSSRSSGPLPSDPEALLEVLRQYVDYLRGEVSEAVNGLNNRLNAIGDAARELAMLDLGPDGARELERLRLEAERATTITAGLLHRLEGTTPAAIPRRARADPMQQAAPAHILVVEDDPANRTVATRLLQRAGHLVTACEDGTEALEVLDLGGVDCVVCDLRMPGLSGQGLFEQVEERLPEAATRFVFVTGDHTLPDTRAFLDRVGQPVIAKPYSAAELLGAVAVVLERAGGGGPA
jgi:CheY-like chemotaxis protein